MEPKYSFLTKVFIVSYLAIYVLLAVLFFPFYVLVSIFENLIYDYKFLFKFVQQDIKEYPTRLKLFLYGNYL